MYDVQIFPSARWLLVSRGGTMVRWRRPQNRVGVAAEPRHSSAARIVPRQPGVALVGRVAARPRELPSLARDLRPAGLESKGAESPWLSHVSPARRAEGPRAGRAAWHHWRRGHTGSTASSGKGAELPALGLRDARCRHLTTQPGLNGIPVASLGGQGGCGGSHPRPAPMTCRVTIINRLESS